MIDDFLIRATLAGIAVAVAAGPLGCFVVWRRMAYFGDATAHAAVLGVALSLALSVSILASVLVTALGMAVLVNGLGGRRLGFDTVLGVAAQGALARGLVAGAVTSPVGVDLDGYLFGGVLALSRWNISETTRPY